MVVTCFIFRLVSTAVALAPERKITQMNAMAENCGLGSEATLLHKRNPTATLADVTENGLKLCAKALTLHEGDGVQHLIGGPFGESVSKA
jgi:hypothetical protein